MLSAFPSERGAGQIIGSADTGLDFRLCFFSDVSQPVVFNTLMPTHRKLALYQTVVDGSDVYAGHGTHTVIAPPYRDLLI
jgi:hypothetical protein